MPTEEQSFNKATFFPLPPNVDWEVIMLLLGLTHRANGLYMGTGNIAAAVSICCFVCSIYFISSYLMTNQPSLKVQMMASGMSFFVGGIVVVIVGIVSWILGNAMGERK